MIENRFNLVDDPWIPVVDAGRVSLRQIFSNPEYCALEGNPIEKIALMKLLLAIAQAAYTPIDDEDWAALGSNGMAQKCLEYLEKWHDRFWLYGERPFLQIPGLVTKEIQSYGAVMPMVATGNTTVLTERQIEKDLNDSERAVLLIVLMGFALGGRTDNSAILTKGYLEKTNEKGKPKTGKQGPSLGFLGYMHSFLLGGTVLETILLNLTTQEALEKLQVLSGGLGTAPWEQMPQGEYCDVAKNLRQTLMGRLVPLSRFCLFETGGLYYTEGISYLDYKEGAYDLSLSVNYLEKKPKVLWIDPQKRPWRSLTSLLNFLAYEGSQKFECIQIKHGLERARKRLATVGIWSGGLRVSSNMKGEQFVRGSDDFVESSIFIPAEYLGEPWYIRFSIEMSALEDLSNIIFRSVKGYYSAQNMKSKDQGNIASHHFWQLCEREFQNIVNACVDDEKPKKMRRKIQKYALKSYDHTCPRITARQLDAWAKNRPNLSKYLSNKLEVK